MWKKNIHSLPIELNQYIGRARERGRSRNFHHFCLNYQKLIASFTFVNEANDFGNVVSLYYSVYYTFQL